MPAVGSRRERTAPLLVRSENEARTVIAPPGSSTAGVAGANLQAAATAAIVAPGARCGRRYAGAGPAPRGRVAGPMQIRYHQSVRIFVRLLDRLVGHEDTAWH